MCLALNLDAFGYLMVMARNRSVSGDVTEQDDLLSNLERMDLVCWTLLSHAAPGVETKSDKRQTNRKKAREAMQNRCRACYQTLEQRVQRKMTEDGQSELKRDFFSVLEMVLEYPEKADHIAPLPPVLKKLPGWLAGPPSPEGKREKPENRQNRYRALAKEMEALWMTVYFSSHIFLVTEMAEKKIWRFSDMLGGHFIALYQTMYASIHGKSQDHGPAAEEHAQPGWNPSHVLDTIGQLYREGNVAAFWQEQNPEDPEPSAPFAHTLHPEFQDTLSFVLYYYYRNWYIYSDWSGFRKTFDSDQSEGGEQREYLNQWLDGLMGGKANARDGEGTATEGRIT